ncbi:TPA: AAA family ATPase [Legionella pneumophila]|nr:AAA family ATPase [Legionella pneumophila]HCD9272263.1 AAA family ATPase [Legionella pneumophila]HCD9278844.1 AAA family ATPase [Legionella pneumophila]HCD9282002.1 AAA family ATPase [Legionella pneumophila]HCD9288240.1 AAA family ATPase [Legionella pneumophila]
MNSIDKAGYHLTNLGKINIVLGKNGSGKSTLLKEIETAVSSDASYGVIKYITPERGGNLEYNPGIDNNISQDKNWMPSTRRVNRYESFRQQSIAQFRNLELLFFREMESNNSLRLDLNHKFDLYFNKLNDLLENIELQRDQSLFKIYQKGTDIPVPPNSISSGESELISLGIECLVFEKQCISDKPNILFLDEPDVHLHPDLQARLSQFIHGLVDQKNAIVILATHSTAILGALSEFDDTHIEFLIPRQKKLNFKKISEEYRKILPIFGAHPLSNIFNQAPIFLVEGEDDERIWQQAIRSSNRKLKIYPCFADGIDNMSKYEKDIQQIIVCVYENAKAYSLRDKDDGSEIINDLDSIVRFRLACRASENLLLADEILDSLNITWDVLKNRIEEWLKSNTNHTHYSDMLSFKTGGFDRKNYDLKEIRNDLMHLIGKNIAWEIAIGKTIGKLIFHNQFQKKGENSICGYLGDKLVTNIQRLIT